MARCGRWNYDFMGSMFKLDYSFVQKLNHICFTVYIHNTSSNIVEILARCRHCVQSQTKKLHLNHHSFFLILHAYFCSVFRSRASPRANRKTAQGRWENWEKTQKKRLRPHHFRLKSPSNNPSHNFYANNQHNTKLNYHDNSSHRKSKRKQSQRKYCHSPIESCN